jgi:hypothetical protein
MLLLQRLQQRSWLLHHGFDIGAAACIAPHVEWDHSELDMRCLATIKGIQHTLQLLQVQS